ncbi:hypothetical protein D3OALGA1CA_1151 [Olavius algarvensis associated proteobacterium Delta 3]|nr:hypothetical protein D3OALGA1CA_1151 [Olavius algarvensis associated proteobacterium Delta 3]
MISQKIPVMFTLNGEGRHEKIRNFFYLCMRGGVLIGVARDE